MFFLTSPKDNIDYKLTIACKKQTIQPMMKNLNLLSEAERKIILQEAKNAVDLVGPRVYEAKTRSIFVLHSLPEETSAYAGSYVTCPLLGELFFISPSGKEEILLAEFNNAEKKHAWMQKILHIKDLKIDLPLHQQNHLPEEDKKKLDEYIDELQALIHSIPEHAHALFSGSEVRFFTFGCAGNGSENQKKVARLMAETIEKQKEYPHFIVLTGDNIYPSGASSPNDPAFISQFYGIYFAALLNTVNDPVLKDLLTFLLFLKFLPVAGNHEAKQTKKDALLGSNSNPSLVKNECAHTFLPDGRYPSVKDKLIYFTKNEIDLTDAPSWTMPYYYYSLDFKETNTQLFFIDSTSLPHAVIDTIDVPDDQAEKILSNQMVWLREQITLAKEKGRKIIGILHHLPTSTSARHYKFDSYYYLSEKQRDILQTLFQLSAEQMKSYHNIIKACLQDLPFDILIGAHDHHSTIKMEQSKCYITAGGGGGNPQRRGYFGDQTERGFFTEEHGFFQVTLHPSNQEVSISFFSKNHHLEFKNTSIESIKRFPNDMTIEEKNQIEQLHCIIKNTVDKYFLFFHDKQTKYNGQFLHKKTNLSHGHEGVRCANELWTVINHKEVMRYAELKNKIIELAKWQSSLTIPKEHSFISILIAELEKECPTTDNELIAQLKASYQLNLRQVMKENSTFITATTLTGTVLSSAAAGASAGAVGGPFSVPVCAGLGAIGGFLLSMSGSCTVAKLKKQASVLPASVSENHHSLFYPQANENQSNHAANEEANTNDRPTFS